MGAGPILSRLIRGICEGGGACSGLPSDPFILNAVSRSGLAPWGSLLLLTCRALFTVLPVVHSLPVWFSGDTGILSRTLQLTVICSFSTSHPHPFCHLSKSCWCHPLQNGQTWPRSEVIIPFPGFPHASCSVTLNISVFCHSSCSCSVTVQHVVFAKRSASSLSFYGLLIQPYEVSVFHMENGKWEFREER